MSDIILFIMLSMFCALAGIIFFIHGIVILINIKNCTSKTYGKVTDIVRHQNYDWEYGATFTWHPVLEYNIGKLKFIKEYVYGNSQSKFTIGQDIEIYYNPEHCNKYYIVGDTIPKSSALVCIISGIGLIIIAIGFAIFN